MRVNLVYFLSINICYCVAVVLPSEASAQAGQEEVIDFKRSYSVYEMVEDFVNGNNPHQASIDMDILEFDDFDGNGRAVFLTAKIKNNTSERICIPSVFYKGEDLVAVEKVLSLRTEDGEGVPYEINPPRIAWPSKEFVIIFPGKSDVTSIDLSSRFTLDDRIDVVDVNFAFPAFFCRTLEKGYPISEEMASASPFGLIEEEPIVAVKKEDIIVYRGTLRVILDK